MPRTKEVIVLYTDDEIGNSIGEIVGEVVRCKDCKFASLTDDGECKYCQRWKEKYDGESVSLYLDGDFYCAFAERKEDERQAD